MFKELGRAALATTGGGELYENELDRIKTLDHKMAEKLWGHIQFRRFGGIG